MTIRTTIGTIIATVLLGISFSASADFRTISRAYEIALSDFRMAPNQNGGVIFKQCPDCQSMAVRVTPKTRYILNGKPVTIREFRKSIFHVRNREKATIIVLRHLETDTIVSLTADL